MQHGGTTSAWLDEPLSFHRAPLQQHLRTDVCIIGAGMAGMMTAYSLARAGRRVVVLDQSGIGGGESGRTTAHLSNAIDDRYFVVEDTHGPDVARVCAESHTAAIDHLERIAINEGIDCEFERLDGYLFLPPGESHDVLTRECEAARRAGLSVELLDSAPSFSSGPALRFPRQATFHPLRFLAGVAAVVEGSGGRIFTETHVVRVQNESPLRVITHAGPTVQAAAVIVAANSPVNDLVTMHTKQAAYRTYVVAARVPRGAIARALYWDTSQTPGDIHGPYHYVRLASLPAGGGNGQDPGELLIIGGEDHLTGEPEAAEDRWARLEDWARQRWPAMQEVLYRWSGQVLEPVDAVAYIGRNPSGPDGVFIATGDSGMGMTHAAIAGLMIPELIQGRWHRWAETYDPARKPVHTIWEYTKQNLHVAARYTRWLRPGDKPDELGPGEGCVVRRGVKLLAVHRDDAGILHERSAVCTHLGCIVRWNPVEKSWDCPCHGSRFAADGSVLNGPAVMGLAESRAVAGALK